MTGHHDAEAEARRAIRRKATLYSLGFLAAGVLLAVAGSALVAWMLTTQGMPFLRTWLIATALLVIPAGIAAFIKYHRG